MSTHAVHPPKRNNLPSRRGPPAVKKSVPSENGGVATDSSSSVAAPNGRPTKPTSPKQASGERTVKKLRPSKALIIPEGTTVSDACRRMAARKVDAVLLTDANGLLSGIVTNKDIATRVISEGLKLEQTIVSKIMTRNPVFIMADTPVMEALQKMVQGKFRHLPVVENGEVIAMLDITKCLYDAISRMEKAAEQGSAIAAAVEGVERQWGSNLSAPNAFVETLRERMFKPTLSTIVMENAKVVVVSPSDPVYVATKKMREFQVNSVIIATGSKLHGILTSKDVLLRVVAQNLLPELTPVEKVMTANPKCVTLDTAILEALHIMHDGKFLHLPVLGRDEHIVACLDVLQLAHAAISMVEGDSGAVNDMANTMMQKLWYSACSFEPADEEYDTHSELSALMTSEYAETVKYMYPPHIGNSFAFKIEDGKGHIHRFNCDSDLVGAVYHARFAGWKVLRLHIDDSETKKEDLRSSDLTEVSRSRVTSLQVGILGATVALAGIGIMLPATLLFISFLDAKIKHVVNPWGCYFIIFYIRVSVSALIFYHLLYEYLWMLKEMLMKWEKNGGSSDQIR
ncbi:hypothetical protein C4D60_Mb09t07810 [Musa balbisiana]|uniref:CBS domain-containing protein n=1 Tax=Musa balbisiana TaxID=52838 RepID=A0A4S8IET9_MUSBA|nr:hypothetical protein C4D60_Mb09t07810 [Musa balbisiana]